MTGTCTENLVKAKDIVRVVLDGQVNTTIQGQKKPTPTVEVRGRGITIKGFTVTGGRDGIMVSRGVQCSDYSR